MVRYVFYRLDHRRAIRGNAEIPYEMILWRPSLRSLAPRGLPLMPYAVWALFHALHVFANRDYAILVVYDHGRVLHQSCVFPRWSRFPFMKPFDLQIGDTWTDPEYRGKGIAAAAIRRIVDEMARPGRSFWYVCEESNDASIRVIEKAGFERVGSGVKLPRLGLSILGYYAMR